MCEDIEKIHQFGERLWLRPECLVLDPRMSGRARVLSALQYPDLPGTQVVTVRLFNNHGARVEMYGTSIAGANDMAARLGLTDAPARGWVEHPCASATGQCQVQLWNDGAHIYGGVELQWTTPIP